MSTLERSVEQRPCYQKRRGGKVWWLKLDFLPLPPPHPPCNPTAKAAGNTQQTWRPQVGLGALWDSVSLQSLPQCSEGVAISCTRWTTVPTLSRFARSSKTSRWLVQDKGSLFCHPWLTRNNTVRSGQLGPGVYLTAMKHRVGQDNAKTTIFCLLLCPELRVS